MMYQQNCFIEVQMQEVEDCFANNEQVPGPSGELTLIAIVVGLTRLI